MDYTFKEFEDDITSAVENDKKRFKGEDVNGEEQHLLYSKPAYETGNFLNTGLQNTRRSRRLMDLDYESDSESKTSGYDYEGNSDDDGQGTSTRASRLRRTRRIIDEDEDENDGGDLNEEESFATERGKKEEEKTHSNGEQPETSKSPEHPGDDNETANRSSKELKTGEDSTETKKGGGSNGKGEKIANPGSKTEADKTNISPSQPQNTAPSGNKIHPHSRIASVAPVARNPPVADMNNYRNPASYPPEGVFPNPPNFEMFKPQFPVKQAPNYGVSQSHFGGANLTTPNITGNNFTANNSGTVNISPSSVPGIAQGGPTFPGAQGVGPPNTRTNYGGTTLSGPSSVAPNFPGANANFPGTNLGGQNIPGTNFGGPFSGGLNNVGSVVGTNFGGTNFGGANPTGTGVGGFGVMKSPTQNVPGSFWGAQSDLNNMYNYQGFPSSAGGTSAPVSSPPNNQTLPPPYPSATRFASTNQYGNYNQEYHGNSNMPNNYAAPPQSGFFPGTPQQPPPPYPSGNSLNANFYSNNTPEGNLTGNQWTYPEGYGYYPGQGNTAGQNF